MTYRTPMWTIYSAIIAWSWFTFLILFWLLGIAVAAPVAGPLLVAGCAIAHYSRSWAISAENDQFETKLVFTPISEPPPSRAPEIFETVLGVTVDDWNDAKVDPGPDQPMDPVKFAELLDRRDNPPPPTKIDIVVDEDDDSFTEFADGVGSWPVFLPPVEYYDPWAGEVEWDDHSLRVSY